MFSTSAFGLLAAGEDPTAHVRDHAIWASHGGFWLLSNHMVMLLTTAVIMLLIFPRLTKPYRDGKLVPTGTRNVFEALMMFVRDNVAKPLLADKTDRFMPLLWTLFFFVLIANLLGLLPLDAIQNLVVNRGGGHGEGVHGFHPIYGTATSNFFVTATLGGIVFCVVQYNGIMANGFSGWLHHFLGGAPWWLAPIMVPVEILGMLIKPFALAVRLAANMTAGHVLIAVLIGFGPALLAGGNTGAGIGVAIVTGVASIAIMLLELFVACLQAYLFVFLTALFIGQMLSHHHEESDHHDQSDGDELGEPHGTHSVDIRNKELKPAH